MFGWGFQFSKNGDKRKSPGFTLVELLVVIGIIAVLIAVIMPVLGKARAAANRTVCLSNIRQLGMGILKYCNNNQGWFPTCAYWASNPAYIQYPDDWLYWEAIRNLDDSPIAKLLNTRGDRFKALLRCPADNFEGRKAAVGIVAGQGPYLYSYGMNEGLATNLKSLSARTRITMWRAPSRKILLTEPLEQSCTCPAWGVGELTWRHGKGNSCGTHLFNEPGKRMGLNASAVFLDGHADGVDDDFACNVFQYRPETQ